jgi:hypothetical protein
MRKALSDFVARITNAGKQVGTDKFGNRFFTRTEENWKGEGGPPERASRAPWLMDVGADCGCVGVVLRPCYSIPAEVDRTAGLRKP